MAYKIGDLTAGTPATSAEFEFSITASGGSRKVTLANLFIAPTAIVVTPAANGTAFTAASATHTASAPVFDGAQTWNNGAVVFTAMKVNVTNTASAAGSLVADFQVGGTSVFKVDKFGDGTIGSLTDSSATVRMTFQGFTVSTASGYKFTNGSAGGVIDGNLSRVSAGVIGVGTGAAGSVAGTLRAAALSANGSDFTITAANSVSPTSPNRTITISYGGTTYYLAAKTTND